MTPGVARLALASFEQIDPDMKTFLETVSVEQLTAVSGGMKWQDFRPSTNVEDRRPEWAKRRDDAWFRGQSQDAAQPAPSVVPLPPRRPAGV